MRKHSPRKWLHAILDLVPVLIIGVFALYTTNKNATFNQEIVVQKDRVVDFNQLVVNGQPSSDLGSINSAFGDISYDTNTDSLKYTVTTVGTQNWTNSVTFILGGFDNTAVYLLSYDIKSSLNIRFYNFVISDDSSPNTEKNFTYVPSDDFTRIQFLVNRENPIRRIQVTFNGQSSNVSVGDSFYCKNMQMFNLTQMYGYGNEPSISEFNSMFPNEYYQYSVSTLVTLPSSETITYSDTDIGSQMVYTLYNTTEKYFNMNQVFNLHDVYNWISTNLFGGNPPLMASVVWNIIVYEFVIDLLFLFYAFFMFIIDFIEYLLDKPFSKARGK